MSESKKKGLFAKIFGGSKSCCCNVRIEEVPEEEVSKPKDQCTSPCCEGLSDERQNSKADNPKK